MAKIKNIKGRQVFDSRGNPTLEAEVFSENGSAFSIVPSGASTGTHEAFELRDKDNKDYLGKSVFAAIGNSNEPGTQAISTCKLSSEVSNPCRFRQSRQPDNILLVIKSLNLAITIPTFKLAVLVKEPSKIVIKIQ